MTATDYDAFVGSAFEQFQALPEQKPDEPQSLESMAQEYLRPKNPLTWLDALKETKERGLAGQTPFVSGGMAGKEAWDLWGAAKRAEAGADTPEDKALLSAFADHASKPKTAGYHFVNILGQLIPYGGEFLATGGIATAGRKGAASLLLRGVEEAAESAAKVGLLRKMGAYAGDTAMRVFLQESIPQMFGAPGRVSASTYQRAFAAAGMTFTEDAAGEVKIAFQNSVPSFLDALPAGAADQLIEIGSEKLGDILPLDRIAVFQSAIFKKWVAKNGIENKADFLRTIATGTGWHGMVGEFIEEKAGAAARAATPGMTETWMDVIGTSEENIGMLAAFAVPGAIATVARAATGGGKETRPAPEGAVGPGAQPETLEDEIALQESTDAEIAKRQEAAKQELMAEVGVEPEAVTETSAPIPEQAETAEEELPQEPELTPLVDDVPEEESLKDLLKPTEGRTSADEIAARLENKEFGTPKPKDTAGRRHVQKVQEGITQRKAAAEEFISEKGEVPFEVPVPPGKFGQAKQIIVSTDPTSGKWRWTRIDDEGPSGHSEEPSYADLLYSLQVEAGVDLGQAEFVQAAPAKRDFPEFEGKSLSWDIGAYMTTAESQEGYPRARAVIRAMAERQPERLERELANLRKSTSDRIFGHNAKKALDVIESEIKQAEPSSETPLHAEVLTRPTEGASAPTDWRDHVYGKLQTGLDALAKALPKAKGHRQIELEVLRDSTIEEMGKGEEEQLKGRMFQLMDLFPDAYGIKPAAVGHVVDRAGKPILVYHGTSTVEPFGEFRREALRSEHNFFFVTDPAAAASYAYDPTDGSPEGGKPRLVSAYVTILDPGTDGYIERNEAGDITMVAVEDPSQIRIVSFEDLPPGGPSAAATSVKPKPPTKKAKGSARIEDIEVEFWREEYGGLRWHIREVGTGAKVPGLVDFGGSADGVSKAGKIEAYNFETKKAAVAAWAEYKQAVLGAQSKKAKGSASTAAAEEEDAPGDDMMRVVNFYDRVKARGGSTVMPNRLDVKVGGKVFTPIGRHQVGSGRGDGSGNYVDFFVARGKLPSGGTESGFILYMQNDVGGSMEHWPEPGVGVRSSKAALIRAAIKRLDIQEPIHNVAVAEMEKKTSAYKVRQAEAKKEREEKETRDREGAKQREAARKTETKGKFKKGKLMLSLPEGQLEVDAYISEGGLAIHRPVAPGGEGTAKDGGWRITHVASGDGMGSLGVGSLNDVKVVVTRLTEETGIDWKADKKKLLAEVGKNWSMGSVLGALRNDIYAPIEEFRKIASEANPKQSKKAKAKARIDTILKDIADDAGKAGMAAFFDPKLLVRATQLAIEHVKLGIYTFQEFVEAVIAEAIPRATLVKAWRTAKKRVPMVDREKMDEPTEVEDSLPPVAPTDVTPPPPKNPSFPEEDQLSPRMPFIGRLFDLWQGDRDRSKERANNRTRKHRKELRRLVGKRTAGEVMKEAASGELPFRRARELDAAVHLNIDLKNAEDQGLGTAQEVFDSYKDKREPVYDEDGNMTDRGSKGFTKEQVALFERSQNLTAEEQAFADKLAAENHELGLDFLARLRDIQRGKEGKKEGDKLDFDVLMSAYEHYSARLWKKEGKAGSAFQALFTTGTGRLRGRTLGSVMEGWAYGLELEITGATAAQNTAEIQVSQVIHDRNFKLAGKKTGVFTLDAKKVDENGDPYEEILYSSFWEWAPSAQISTAEGAEMPEVKTFGRVIINDGGTIFTQHRVYAQKETARRINRILGLGKKRDEATAMNALLKYNAWTKATILFTSFFHFLAFIRSYVFGTPAEYSIETLNIAKALRDGTAAIEEFGPDVQLLVHTGLTVAAAREFAEWELQEKTWAGAQIDKVPMLKEAKNTLVRVLEWQADLLFKKFGPALKVQAALFELAHLRRKFRKKLESGEITDRDLARIAARVVNDDFGGLNLARMNSDEDWRISHRTKKGQEWMRLFFLAPDWTESNVRSMLGMIQGGGTKYNPKETSAVYRELWGRIAIKYAASITALNVMMAAMDDDDFWERYEKAWETGNMRVLYLDITPLVKKLGFEAPRRQYLNVVGHFTDPVKFVLRPVASAKHKASVFAGTILEAIHGKDWQGKAFTNIDELMETGEAVKWKFTNEELTYEKIPSFLLSQAKRMAPIPVQNFAAYLVGEMEGSIALMKSVGLAATQAPPKKDSK